MMSTCIGSLVCFISGDLLLLVDHLLERFHESSIYRKQSLLLLNEIILGTAARCSKDSSSASDHHYIIGQAFSLYHYLVFKRS